MAIQDKTLSGAEHDYFATLSGLSANAPLSEHKAKVFSDAGHGGAGKPLSQMEREWLQKVALSNKINEGDLWREVVASIGLTPSVSTSENKFLFYTSPAVALQTYIKSLSGLVAYYPLNETTGNSINRAPDTFGTFNGTVTEAVQGQDGQIGKSYSFDGSNDAILLKDGSFVSGLTNYTVSLIFKTSRTPTGGSGDSLYSERAASGNDILKLEVSAEVTTKRLRPVLRDDATTLDKPDNNTGRDVTDNSWHYGVLRQQGSTIKVFVDGSEDFSFTKTSLDNFTNANLKTYVCRDVADSGAYCQAFVQHVAIFNTNLTDAQILRMAQLAGLA